MKKTSLAVLGGLAALVTVFAAAFHAPVDPETARLLAHFDTVDAELRSADVSRLSLAQRATRAQMVRWLRDYRDIGSFPRNDRIAGRRAPFFRDSRGVLCAMAYLIARSGRADLVDRVARTRNHAYIPELAGDADLADWLRRAGLSVTEAARIQPAYDYGDRPESRDDDDDDEEYLIGSGVLGVTSLVATGFNLVEPGRRSAWTGALAGSANLLLGLGKLDHDQDDSARDLAIANVLIGVVALAVSARGFEAPVPESTATTLRLTPALVPVGTGFGAGVALSARF